MDTTLIRRVGSAACAALPAAVLIAWWPASLAAFAPYKALVLCAAVALAAASVALSGARPLPRSLLLAWLSISAALALAAIAGIDPWRSLRGTYPRYESLPALMAATAMAWLVPALLDRRNLARASELLFAAITVSGVYGVLQAVGQDPLHVIAGGRAWGTVGNPVLLGTAMALLAPYPLAVTLTGRGTAWMRRLAPFAAASAIAAGVVSQARGGWLGLLIGAAVVVGLLWRSVRRGRATAVGAAVVLAIAVALVVPASRQVLSGRFALTGGPAASVQARILKYEVGAQLVARRPLTGWGWDTVAEVYPSRLPRDWLKRDPEGLITDRLHNDWLDVAAGSGLLGLAACLALAFVAVRSALPGLHSSGTARTLTAGLLAGAAGYLAASMTAFPSLATWPLLWSTLGLAAAVGIAASGPGLAAGEGGGADRETSAGGEDRSPAQEAPAVAGDAEPRQGSGRAARLAPSTLAAAAAAILAAAAIVGTAFAAQDIAADQALFKATMTPGNVQALAYGSAAARFPGDAYVQLRAADGLLALGRAANDLDVLREAERAARRAALLRPLDPAYLATLADSLLALALRGDAKLLPETSRAYAGALARAPYDLTVLKNAGVAQFARETTAGYSAAADLWRTAYAVDPTDSEVSLDLALAYERLGRKALARTWIDRAAALAPDRTDITAVKKRLAR